MQTNVTHIISYKGKSKEMFNGKQKKLEKSTCMRSDKRRKMTQFSVIPKEQTRKE